MYRKRTETNRFFFSLFLFAQVLCVFLYSVPVFRKPCVKQRTLHGAYTSVRFLAVSFETTVFSSTRIIGEHALHMLARFYALCHMYLAFLVFCMGDVTLN